MNSNHAGMPEKWIEKYSDTLRDI